jgi:DNA-binding IclR family transcriptional regulator
MQSFTGKHETSHDGSGPYKVQVLDRAVAILELLSNSASEMSLGELTAAIGLHKSTVHRLLMVLEGHSLVDKSPLNGRYRLGMKLFELGSLAVANLNLRERARSRLEWLVAQTGETVHLCVMDRGEMLYIDKLEPERSVRISSRIGRRVGVHCSAVGKAMLACLPVPSVREILRQRGMTARTPHTFTDPDLFIAELDSTRTLGYALDNEEAEEGVHCVAVPIFDCGGKAVAAISISGPSFRFDQQRSASMVESLRTVARELSQNVGSPKPGEAPLR